MRTAAAEGKNRSKFSVRDFGMSICEPADWNHARELRSGYQYDNANRRTSLTLPNGVTVGYSFDNDARITGLTYSAGSTQLGNLTYGYDADGRVTSKNGTLAAINLPTAVSGNTFNANNGMTAFGGATLSYDANGNLTSDGTNNYTWDARNHLTAVSGAATASFVYDAFGRRAEASAATLISNRRADQQVAADAPRRFGAVERPPAFLEVGRCGLLQFLDFTEESRTSYGDFALHVPPALQRGQSHTLLWFAYEAS